MNQEVKLTLDAEVNVTVNGNDWGGTESRRFWLHAFLWNLRKRAWSVAAGNLRDLPRYLKG